MEQTRDWSPILEGPDRDRALEVVGDIAAALRDPDNPWVKETSMAGGQAGVALFYTYKALCDDSDEDAETALTYIEQALERATQNVQDPALYGGLTGVAWVVQHLKDRLLDPEDVEEVCQLVDGMVLGLLETSPWRGDYDLISGLVGFGVYLLERLPDETAKSGLVRIVDHLEATKETTDTGIAWHTPPERLPAWQREIAPRGYYNLGLAHGVPGIIGLLGELQARSIAEEKTRPLLEGAVSWLQSQKLPADAKASFASWAGPGIDRGASRVAWCYGDLGLGAALLLAARCAEDPAWEREALEITRRSARRREDAGAVDAGLCHGTAGNAHIYNRLFQATGDQVLLDAARYWFAQTLEMRKVDRSGSIAGYVTLGSLGSGDEPSWRPDPGFLTGVAGVALALLAAAQPVAPCWDSVMLVSV
jgi:lantibiotic modifying enzyme